jgi:hypothetical protein
MNDHGGNKSSKQQNPKPKQQHQNPSKTSINTKPINEESSAESQPKRDSGFTDTTN